MPTTRRIALRSALLLSASASVVVFCSIARAQDATPVPDVSVTASPGIPAPVIGQPADAEGFNNVVVARQTTGSKTDAPITDVPQSVVVIPNKIIDDQNITNQADALQNVAGVQIAGFPGYTLNGNYALIRGFSVSEYMLNGMYDQTNAANLPFIGQDVERIEVLKGSSALLYGPTIGSIGGIVNTVTKKPLLNPSYLFGTTVDNFGMVGLYMDVSHPLTEDKNWLVRVTGDLRTDPTFVQNGRQQIGDGSITIQGQIDPATTLTFFYQHIGLQANQILGQPVFTNLGYPFQFARSANPSVLQAQPYQAQSNAIQIELDHQINSNWISRTSVGWVGNTNYNSQYGVSWNDDGTGSWYYYHEHFDRQALNLDTNFNGKFMLFGHANDLVVGATYLYNPTS
ncbi:TonB-dependent siderophore receptor [Methylocella sp.]|uniref:TonB-dependent siderophore receptor n=1 Tax=Methylocella sp. TaxID=1978226 RepID=UPI0035B3C242